MNTYYFKDKLRVLANCNVLDGFVHFIPSYPIPSIHHPTQQFCCYSYYTNLSLGEAKDDDQESRECRECWGGLNENEDCFVNEWGAERRIPGMIYCKFSFFLVEHTLRGEGRTEYNLMMAMGLDLFFGIMSSI